MHKFIMHTMTQGLSPDDYFNELRALHNSETACKNSDFCPQLGGKAEFMAYK